MTTTSLGYTGLDERIAANGSTSVWIGDKAQLRAIEPDDATVLALHPDSADERSGWMIMPPQSPAATRKSYEAASEKRSAPDTLEFSLVIARREDNLMVGGIDCHGVDRNNGTFAYGVTIQPEHKGNGYAAEAILLLLRFMFDERRFQKCEPKAYAFNASSVNLHRKLGFVEEGRLRSHLFMAGERRDVLLFGMTADEFHELYPGLKSTL